MIEHLENSESSRAILYLHGYTDYFFQTELAEHFAKQGYRFFAIDLQGYGRSIRPNSPPNWCDSMHQYHDDIRIALAEIANRGVSELVIMAHSTGGLVASSYLAKELDMAPERQLPCPTIKGLILNSPFLELPFPPRLVKRISWPIWVAVSLLPFHALRAKKISTYAKTLHKCFAGEWGYRLDWKPAQGFPLSFHWLKQVILAQRDLKQQIIQTPTLMCHSAISTLNNDDVEATRQGDGVLDVDSMKAAAKQTFECLTTQSIQGGYHDLMLSPADIRKDYLRSVDQWLNNTAFLTNT
ncbi:alpha/beta hydrolase [Marinomonas piezotolerans]|uniref:Alpha/beta hydrolase n=2 Tax=Marinomonas piezotolerans TaxID=2213058 RepID=A0A370UAI7_9GAMM|nr:alpha/beta hydrolase [Marinomonas piezotolerans]